MFEKLKSVAEKNIEAAGCQLDKVKSTISESSDGLTATIKAKTEDIAHSAKEFSMMDRFKSFALSATNTVQEIDEYLINSRSQYEVSNFHVMTTAGVTAGMTLDIHFTKHAFAKELSQDKAKFLVVTNPETGNQIKIPAKSLVDKETVKVRDPVTQAVLTVDVKSGKVMLSQ